MPETVEVILATMNQNDDSIIDQMNIQSDIIVCNQTIKETSYKKYIKNGFNVRWYNFQEFGIGLNRNNGILRSTADICIIADDDVVYDSDYVEKVLSAFQDNPHADMILFNIHPDDSKTRYICNKKHKVNMFNCGRFGGVRICFRRNSIIKNSISFNQLFGGGALFSAGEDNMFIRDCIRKGLSVIAVPDYYLSLSNNRESTWFRGYDDKYFSDMGSSYVYHYGTLAYLAGIIQLIRHRKKWLANYSIFEAYFNFIKGVKYFKKL